MRVQGAWCFKSTLPPLQTVEASNKNLQLRAQPDKVLTTTTTMTSHAVRVFLTSPVPQLENSLSRINPSPS